MDDIAASRQDFKQAMREVKSQLGMTLVDETTAILRGSLEMLILEHIHGAINAVPLNPPDSYSYRFARRS
jgi:hypothetical protein